MKSSIVFAEEKIKEAFEKLKDSKYEDKMMYEWLIRAFNDLENDASCGIQISRKLTPKEYIDKYGIDNLWKYDLPNGWRLIYSIG